MIPGKLYTLKHGMWIEGILFPANTLMVYLKTEKTEGLGWAWAWESSFLYSDGVVRKWFHNSEDAITSNFLPATP